MSGLSCILIIGVKYILKWSDFHTYDSIRIDDNSLFLIEYNQDI